MYFLLTSIDQCCICYSVYFCYCTHGCVCQLVIKENADDDDDDDDDGAILENIVSNVCVRSLTTTGCEMKKP